LFNRFFSQAVKLKSRMSKNCSATFIIVSLLNIRLKSFKSDLLSPRTPSSCLIIIKTFKQVDFSRVKGWPKSSYKAKRWTISLNFLILSAKKQNTLINSKKSLK
jgi:hypothetical protein